MQDYSLSVGEKFASAQRIISALYPSLTSFYIMCNKREVPGITIRLNTKIGLTPTIEFSSSFVNTLTCNTLSVLLSIELFRLVLHHPTTRLLYPTDICYKASNIICTDINNILTLPMDLEVKKSFPTFGEVKKINPDLDPKTDFYLEKIFGVLNSAAEKDKKKSVPLPGGAGEGVPAEGDEDGESSKGDANGDGEDSKKDGGNNQANTKSSEDGQEPKSDKPNNGNSDNGSEGTPEEIERESIKKHFSSNNMSKSTEGWGENEMLDTKVRNQILREMSSNNWGRMPGDMKDRIAKLNELRYDPKAIFAKFTRSVFSTVETFTRMKPPRRAGQDYIGIISGKRHEQQAKVLIAFDSSGSMSDEDLQKGLGFMENCLRHAEVYYCWWDWSCTDFEKIKHPKPEYDLTGRGGTDPNCVMAKLEETKMHFDGIVFFTDCYFEWAKPKTKHNICIVRTDHSAEPPDWVKWSFKLKDLAKYC